MGGTPANQVDYFTIATLGSAQDFGDLTQRRHYGAGAASKTRICAAGGFQSPTNPTTGLDTIDYAQIMSLSNFIDFGDLTWKMGLTGGLLTSREVICQNLESTRSSQDATRGPDVAGITTFAELLVL